MSETICPRCQGKGIVIAEMDSKDLPDGLVWQYICPDCDSYDRLKKDVVTLLKEADDEH